MWLKRASALVQDRAIRAFAFAIALMIAVAATFGGLSASFEASIRDARDTLRISPASGEIVLLEIDGRSLQALDQWPWPRGYYADAVRELDRLGAAQIAFDVDFSSRSTSEQDNQFAQALADLDGSVILSTFRQENQSNAGTIITEALPIKALREHSFLASVNVFPNAEGQIEFYPSGVLTNQTPRPSLPTMVAERAGRVGDFFRLDQAIDPATIDRISFVDLLEGKVPREQVSGKRIIVGSTAIELGDRYPTALFGVKSGVVIQAQAAETLIQNRVRNDSGPWLPMAAVALFLLTMIARNQPRMASWQILALASVPTAVALALDQFSLIYIELFAGALLIAAFLSIDRALASGLALQSARMTDTASQLPNRRAMEAQMVEGDERAIAVARIDDFAQIEAVIDSTTAPRLEAKLAERLALLAAGGPVYRLDRAMFAWFVPGEQTSTLEDHFAAARSVFNSPIELDEKRLKINARFGSSTGSISEAITAAEYARRQSINWSSTAVGLQDEAQFQQRILSELDNALTSGALYVLYQPKLRLSDKKIYGAECLIRWDSETFGTISPTDFIPILESKGQIAELTKFVLDNAIKRSRESSIASVPMQLAVNVSAQLLSDRDFINAITKTLIEARDDGVPSITLEVTESAPLQDPDLAKRALNQLTEAGARISIDDYGTGQATLNYLQGFPAQEIKLDQSFVRNLAQNQADRIMVQSTIDLAHALSFEIVAEGVEDLQTLELLTSFKCDYVQGWHVGKPMKWHSFLGRINMQRDGMSSAIA